jgi:hypothetical protein
MHSTDNLEDGYIGSGTRLWHSINKYGKENHICEILEFLPDRKSLKNREIEIVNADMLNEQLCMNLRLGGEGGIIDEKHHLKMREGSSKWTNKAWNDGIFENAKKQWSDNLKKCHTDGKLRHDTFTGRIHSKETKAKMSEKASKRIGEKNSQYGTVWITNGIESQKINKNDAIPEGWRLGRKM